MGGPNEVYLRCGRGRHAFRRRSGASKAPEQMANIMFWLEGSYTEESDPTTIDFAKFKSTLEQLLTYCSNNPTVGVLTAADEIIGKDEQ